ncbi:MAG TPA: hypothetical protein VMH39_11105 [Gemmatimonadaceae bacterium]|nr:hypothetical protein [Gemmatimonadaceae bacterium]
MKYVLLSRSVVIGHAKPLRWSPEPDQLFLQLLPTPAYETVRARIDAMLDAVEHDSPEHPYDAYPDLVELDLQLRNEHGRIVSSGTMSVVVGTSTMEQAPDHTLRELGIEPVHPLLFLSATYGQSLEDVEPERHRGRTPAEHARPKKKAVKRSPPTGRRRTG